MVAYKVCLYILCVRMYKYTRSYVRKSSMIILNLIYSTRFLSHQFHLLSRPGSHPHHRTAPHRTQTLTERGWGFSSDPQGGVRIGSWESPMAPRKCSSPRFPSLRHQGSCAGEPVPLALCFFRPTGASEHPAPPLSTQACAHLMGAQLRAVSPACRAVEDSLLYPSPFLIK